MPKGYHHMTREQRSQLDALKWSGFTQCAIASFLDVSPSTISRELARNLGQRGYRYKQADRLAVKRRQQASKQPSVMIPETVQLIEQYLKEQQWSPEQISGRLKLEGVQVSHERIYQHVWQDKQAGGSLYLHLRHHGKKYNKRSSGKAGRGCLPNRIDIEDRPAIVERKSRVGDWEGDTIVGARQQGAILSYVDRKSKITILEKLTEKTAQQVEEKTIKRFGRLPRLARTITYDNGKEFSKHESIAEQLEVNCYFAKPYHSWERGLNEHTNGLVRQYFPKATNLKLITEEELADVENLLNNRPRKVLGYKTPKEVFLRALNSTEKIALQG